MDAKTSTPPYCVVSGDGRNDRLELHVLVRAYCAAWLALHSKPPAGRHALEQLGVAVHFDETPAQR